MYPALWICYMADEQTCSALLLHPGQDVLSPFLVTAGTALVWRGWTDSILARMPAETRSLQHCCRYWELRYPEPDVWMGSAGAGDAIKRFCSKEDGDFTSPQNQSLTYFSEVSSRYPRRLRSRGLRATSKHGQARKASLLYCLGDQ